jgi:hypothetical protein
VISFAINLHDEPERGAQEVDDERLDHLLLLEPDAQPPATNG